MKNKGFTLAEILVTLGIIGVISALTLPTFTQGSNMAKVGPLLGKAKANFEQATLAMLQDEQIDNLSSSTRYGNANQYDVFLTNLSNHMKGYVMPRQGSLSNTFVSADGVKYKIASISRDLSSSNPYNNMFYSEVNIDINGTQGPNRDSKDIFYFELRDDGSLVPWGSQAIPEARRANKGGLWTANCPQNTVPTDAKACAGHIFDNGLKAEYK